MIYLQHQVEYKQFNREKITTTMQNEKKKFDELIELQKLQLKVRPCVLERRNWQKFGQVANTKKGEHKHGDYQKQGLIAIETEENSEKFEIDIVNRIKQLDTGEIKQNMQKTKNKMNDPIQNAPQNDKEAREARMKERDNFFAQSQAQNEVSIKIENVALQEGEEFESDFTEFVNGIIRAAIYQKHGLNDYNRYFLRIVRNRGYDSGLIRCFISFKEKQYAQAAFDALADDRQYDSCVLAISWAQPSKRHNDTKAPGMK